jgi:hypothetical protein
LLFKNIPLKKVTKEKTGVVSSTPPIVLIRRRWFNDQANQRITTASVLSAAFGR